LAGRTRDGAALALSNGADCVTFGAVFVFFALSLEPGACFALTCRFRTAAAWTAQQSVEAIA
jgi:hypothetical protein